MQFRLSIIAISLVGLLSIAPIAKAAEEWEYTEGTADIEAKCPCFGQFNGLQWANLKIAGSLVDIHRPSSCAMNNNAISMNYVYNKAARKELEGIPFSGMIDGVHYNHLGAIFDAVNDTYECSEDDVHQEISAAEAEACHKLLTDTCANLVQNICPCYSVHDLIQVERDAVNNKVEISGEKTCTESDAESSVYGLFEVSDVDRSVTTRFGIQQNGDYCFDGSEDPQETSGLQAIHCQILMKDSCDVIKVRKPEVGTEVGTDEASCEDDASFLGNGRAARTCASWVTEDPKRRCKKKLKSGKRVFEFCRETCGYCACKDETDTNCCKNNPKFLFWDIPDLDCVWAAGDKSKNKAKKRAKRCKYTAVARNCPEMCGMCPAQ